jgi:hypothetical protein
VIESSNGLFLLLILSRDCKFAVTNDYNWCHKLIFVSWGVFFVKISICREESIEEMEEEESVEIRRWITV